MKTRKTSAKRRTSRAVTAVAVMGALAAASPVLAGASGTHPTSTATPPVAQTLRALERLHTHAHNRPVELTEAQLANIEGTYHPAQAYFGLTTAALNRPALPDVPGFIDNYNETLVRDEG